MTDFSAITAFGLIRRLAAVGLETPSLYLLICDAPAMRVIQADIAAEVQVQLGVDIRVLAAADIELKDAAAPVTLVTFERWIPKLAAALDRNIVLLTTAGAVLLLANHDVAEHMLAAAPNLRNRLSDVLAIRPDEAFAETVA